MSTGRCDNPMCTCDPCGCNDCQCGTARLGELESQVMEILWRHGGEMTGRQVADELPESAYTTVATILERLVGKELVERRKVGGRIHFTPIGSPGARAAVLMRQAMGSSDDAAQALGEFVRTLSADERSALETALTER